MNEETAVEVWRELAPLEASVRRRRRLAVGDQPTFDVAIPALTLSGKDIASILRVGSSHGLEPGVVVEQGVAFMVLFKGAS